MKKLNFALSTLAFGLFTVFTNLSAQMQGMSMGADTMKSSGHLEKMIQMMGKPTFNQSIDGMRVQVWLITQEEHKNMMKSMMKDSSMGGDMKHDMGQMMHGGMKMEHGMQGMDMKHGESDHEAMMKEMMSGTHHIMAFLADEKTGSPVQSAAVEVELLSPSQKAGSVRLHTMKDHFGGGLNLDEKGEYVINVKINVAGKYHNARFLFSTNEH